MKTWISGKNILFAVIGALTIYVLYHNERFLIEPRNPVWQHFEPFKWWLLAHGAAGFCVLASAPLQFSERLRKKYTRLHRVLGRVYVAGTVILSILGVYIQYLDERQGIPRTFTSLAVVNAVMLIGATGIAFLFAVRRKITLHRQWIFRSYAIALVFIVNRFVLGVTGLENHRVEVVEAVIWACLSLSVLFGDVAINWLDIGNSLKPATPAPTRAAVRKDLVDAVTETR